MGVNGTVGRGFGISRGKWSLFTVWSPASEIASCVFRYSWILGCRTNNINLALLSLTSHNLLPNLKELRY